MWVDFTQSFSGTIPYPPSMPAPTFETLRCVETDGINVQRYAAPTHVGTHVDAPRHFVEGGETIDELALDRFAGEGVVLDVSTQEPAEIAVADVENAPGKVQVGDIVLLYTGWGEKFGTDAYDPHPWLSTELASWFVDREVSLVGLDVTTPDRPITRRPEGWMEYPVHHTLLGAGVLVAEHLTNLSPYTGRRLTVQAFPLKFEGGDGAPARIVGRV